ncbi:alpha/beta fold hydrolase [Haloarcula marina]|uniref:alpha/beta fold hydrolase n=1 Tax=Haloarcula marina TaxID=2961574 RepID=UPI0020B865E9|nr:alpha/beta hydrolase [Halomicroarcula marina]
METVGHDGRTTAYRAVDDGDGPATLYVHGSGGTGRVWGNQYAPGGPTHPAAAVDLSGHGESDDIETGAGTETLSAYAADVVAVARATDADVLVGNSLGGAVALWTALETAWEPSALVLTGTGPTLPVFEGLREWLATDFERAVDFLHGEDRLFHDADPGVEERSREQMRATGQRVTRRDFLTCHTYDVADRLGEISVPTLALCGEYDTLTPLSYHERLAAEIPNAEFERISEAAHLAMLERPGAFNEAVRSFLDTADL